MKNRWYQDEAIEAVHEVFASAPQTVFDVKKAGARSALIVLATGLGKTHIFANIARDSAVHGRTLVLAHRAELVYQAADKLRAVTGREPGIEMGFENARNTLLSGDREIVATVQTMSRGRMSKYDPNEFGLVIVDEAHHAAAKSYRDVIAYFCRNPDCKVLGVTATPKRADKAGLGHVFETCPYTFDLQDGIEDGWLVEPQQSFIQCTGLDFSGIKKRNGDLANNEVADEMERKLQSYCVPMVEKLGERKTLVFAASVAHAERMTEILNRYKAGSADFVTGSTPREDRKRVFAKFAARETQYLVNVGVATEGFDDPGIEAVVMARPTMSLALYTQMVGRGTRPLPNTVDGLESADERRAAIAASKKPEMLVVDFAGNAGKHKLVSLVDVLGGKHPDEVLDRVRNKQKSGVDTGDLQKDLAKAQEQYDEEERRRIELEKKREAENRRHLVAKATWTETRIPAFDNVGLKLRGDGPSRQPSKPITDKQHAFLVKGFGVPPKDLDGMTSKQASRLIGALKMREKKGLATYQQAQALRKFGYVDTNVYRTTAANTLRKIQSGEKRPPVTTAIGQ